MQMGRKNNVHTKREEKKNTVQYLLKKKKNNNNIIESMNIALIVHFTPQTLREARGGGHVVSSSEMAGGKKKSQEGHTPRNRHGVKREGGEKGGGKGGVCVLTFFVDIQKRQDPVSKHLFRL